MQRPSTSESVALGGGKFHPVDRFGDLKKGDAASARSEQLAAGERSGVQAEVFAGRKLVEIGEPLGASGGTVQEHGVVVYAPHAGDGELFGFFRREPRKVFGFTRLRRGAKGAHR